MGIFTFIRGRIPLSDNNLANAKALGSLPYFDVLGFSQFRVLSPLREFPQHPQIWANQGWTTAGIGGLIAGNNVFQPLTANPNPGQ